MPLQPIPETADPADSEQGEGRLNLKPPGVVDTETIDPSYLLEVRMSRRKYAVSQCHSDNNDFFCANIFEDQAQWRNKTKGLSKLVIRQTRHMFAEMHS